MKQLQGLDALMPGCDMRPGKSELANRLMEDLSFCRCCIYGQQGDREAVLAELSLADDSLYYDRFDQRIDMVLVGSIINDACAPLTYRLQGEFFVVSGRCSLLPQVCGVDWYLGGAYRGKMGDFVRLKFSISMREVRKRL